MVPSRALPEEQPKRLTISLPTNEPDQKLQIGAPSHIDCHASCQTRGADREHGENLETLGISLAAQKRGHAERHKTLEIRLEAQAEGTTKINGPKDSDSWRRPCSRRKSQNPQNQTRKPAAKRQIEQKR